MNLENMTFAEVLDILQERTKFEFGTEYDNYIQRWKINVRGLKKKTKSL